MVIGADAPARLDKALAALVPQEASLSRSRLMKMIAEGDVSRGGVVVTDAKAKVIEGEEYALRLAPAVAVETLAELGLEPDSAGKRVVVTIQSREKARVLAALARNGVEIDDFELERGSWTGQQ